VKYAIQCLALAIGLLAATANATDVPVVSVSANAAANAKDFLSGVHLVQSMGVRGQFISYTWHDLEPSRGTYKLDDLEGGLHYLGDTLGDTLLVGVQVLNTTVKEVPEDLKATSFGNPQMQARARALLDRIAKLPDARHVHYLSIGNEVDVYFTAHPSEWRPYEQFYSSLAAYAHKVLPPELVDLLGQLGTAAATASAYVDARAARSRLSPTSRSFSRQVPSNRREQSLSQEPDRRARAMD
jgi:hypothetical protein